MSKGRSSDTSAYTPDVRGIYNPDEDRYGFRVELIGNGDGPYVDPEKIERIIDEGLFESGYYGLAVEVSVY